MSRHLEQSFQDIEIEKIIVRPSYYFSNWLGYFETAQQYGVLPTFFPENLKIAMHSPLDLAEFLAQLQRQKLFSINFRPDFGPPFLQLTEPQ